MSTVKKSLSDAKPLSKVDIKRLKAMSDSNIDYSDIPELDDDFFKNAKITMPPAKKQITVRLDEDILEWFKARGKGYQTRMNAVLRAFVEAQHPR
jgi:uncharacterized protein (DUF4415 family)